MTPYGRLAINGYSPQLGNDMTAPEKKPLRVIDWLAIRKAYEESHDPLTVIAAQYGTSISAMALRRRKENWLTRRNRSRLERGLAAFPSKHNVAWAGVRQEYEKGEFPVRDICERHGIGLDSFYSEARRDNWRARRPYAPQAFSAGAKVKTTERLRDLVTHALAGLESAPRLGEKIDTDDALRGLHQLASLTVKILDIEHREKLRDDGDRLNASSSSTMPAEALAKRLDELARAWKHKRDSL